MSQGKRDGKPQADPLEAFSEALRERVASREALLAEGKAMTARRRKAGKAAKASLLSLVLAGSLWWLDPAWHTEQVLVAVGEQRELVLADGSQVLLDSASRLQIERRLHSRQLELVEGQARFTVVHANAPFIVRSQGVRVRDIGTVFDVRSDVRGVRVGVLEGAVEVGSGHGAVQPLRAGQQLLATANERVWCRPCSRARWLPGAVRCCVLTVHRCAMRLWICSATARCHCGWRMTAPVVCACRVSSTAGRFGHCWSSCLRCCL
ncbi:hypothetical protein GLGCALEP_04046 [Pseudomonas sp. MM221]|nr:hypothetical protein GLGCALEP_04046 [Pseudomonas sp. MM221]